MKSPVINALIQRSTIKRITIVLGLVGVLASCAQSPTGRNQVLLVSDKQMDAMGVESYAQMKQKQPLSKNSAMNTRVACVAKAIVQQLDDSQREGWEVNVFETPQPNAFALPGKKIGVNSGMMSVAQTPDQLAAVMGHEVGHVLAKHGAERVSIQMATQGGMKVLRVISGEPSPMKNTLFGLLGAGAQFGVTLPFSRKHESEADLIGLELMAKAGFNPQASVELWQNMAKVSKGAPPEFMSTHPSHSTRISALQKNISSVQPYYQQAVRAGRAQPCG